MSKFCGSGLSVFQLHLKKNLILSVASILLSFCSHNKKVSLEKKYFKFYTQYNQFYLTSVGKGFDIDAKKDMNSFNEDMIKRLGIENNALIAFTQSYGDIKGHIEVLEKPNTNIDYNKFDHIVEGGIDVQTGNLQILNSPDSNLELSIKLNPGKYRVRVYSSNLSSVREPDLSNDTDNDYYRIEVWPSDDMERKVLKQYNEPHK